MDAHAAGEKINPTTHDIDDWVLDIDDELYELKDKNNKPVDITYSVASVVLPEIKKAT
jgi:hypothetical protein